MKGKEKAKKCGRSLLAISALAAAIGLVLSITLVPEPLLAQRPERPVQMQRIKQPLVAAPALGIEERSRIAQNVVQEALQTGNMQAALNRFGAKLSPDDKALLGGITSNDLAVIQNMNAKLGRFGLKVGAMPVPTP